MKLPVLKLLFMHPVIFKRVDGRTGDGLTDWQKKDPKKSGEHLKKKLRNSNCIFSSQFHYWAKKASKPVRKPIVYRLISGKLRNSNWLYVYRLYIVFRLYRLYIHMYISILYSVDITISLPPLTYPWRVWIWVAPLDWFHVMDLSSTSIFHVVSVLVHIHMYIDPDFD